MSSPQTVTIYVRAPNGSFTNYHINTTPESSIASIKQHICTSSTFKPSPQDQRLIFQGKLLSDEELVGEIFGKANASASRGFYLVLRSGATDKCQTYTSSFSAPSRPPSQAFLPSSSGDITSHPIPNLTIVGAPHQYQYVLINLNLSPTPPLGAQVLPEVQPRVTERTQRDRQLAQSMWLIFRLVFFAYLFGQGASFERMILISVACIVIFLCQCDGLRVVRARINQLNPRNPPEIPLPDHQNQARAQHGSQESQSTSLPQELPTNTLDILKIAVLTFFKSIIPNDRVHEFQPDEVDDEAF
ncbi:hypothetical protein K493DRAFT_337531 [Basidiobolus meristosporus CBS 931.73]|uniref:Ubiquitin-like domain-containing protein n=1 Tax=Basidiobolus meristosporus CBS 931.73 TaxID=1314790 RepID=A0A1Y1YAR0_9FUNG|nr:hypothetical protein K493DRAFT_337531 [Basidiobolus meristosporus CBS 931.73]|eukprot:ORX95022.1 hypothetical protein K493DRAFT_337531 [Basidiobolus meristosporus CBS 931.73]